MKTFLNKKMEYHKYMAYLAVQYERMGDQESAEICWQEVNAAVLPRTSRMARDGSATCEHCGAAVSAETDLRAA
jgi:hypothetical protein